MKYLLSCRCGQCVKVEPGQAGQTAVCTCGENLIVPSMLQVKSLPIAPEETKAAKNNDHSPFIVPLINFGAGTVFLALSALLWFGLIDRGYLFLTSFALGCTLLCTACVMLMREATGTSIDEDTTIRRSFFIIGIVLLFLSFCLAVFLYQWKPEPFHVALKREYYSFGSYKRPLYQNSTPILPEEHTILWMTNEKIDQMMPMELYLYFLTLEHPTFSYNFVDNYEAVKDTYRIWVTVNIILFLLAVSSITVSFFLSKQTVVVTGWSGSEW